MQVPDLLHSDVFHAQCEDGKTGKIEQRRIDRQRPPQKGRPENESHRHRRDRLRGHAGAAQKKGYERASLAVQKANYAVRMYEKVGFRTVDENDEEFIMVCEL